MNISQSTPRGPSLDDVVAARDIAHRLRAEVARSYKGAQENIDLILIALIAGGHVLLEGVPGVAKTTLVKAVASTLGCDMRRIQFTPDLLPQDITGTYVLDPRSGQFSLRKGPLFAGIVLADEINRAPARTQSALLEAMQEHQVTIEGERYPLPDPFFVLATQNPLDLEGTYPLPEAQIDRFLVQLELGYPTQAEEVAMLKTHGVAAPTSEALANPAVCRQLRALASRVHVEDDLLEYATSVTRFTRTHPKVVLGCSPRATLGLVRAARAAAILAGRPYATPDDVRTVAPYVLCHRLLMAAEFDGTQSERQSVIREALARVSFHHPVRSGTATDPPR